MAPFHPLREETRALAARVLAAFAVFCAIATVLLAGSAPGQVASAETKDKGVPDGKGDTAVQLGEAAPTEPNGNAGGNGRGNW